MSIIIKERFQLLKDVPNILNIGASTLSAYKVDEGTRKIFVVLTMNNKKIKHDVKDYIYSFISNVSLRNSLKIVYLDKYPLPVSYSQKSDEIILNLYPFNTDDIANIDPKNIFASMVYSLCFYRLVSGKQKIPQMYSSVIINFLLSVFIRLFGKDYGLTGAYVTEIPKLKFLLSCYIYESFFGIPNGPIMYRNASVLSQYDYKEENIINQLKTYDFANIESFIKSLSEMKVMPGITRYSFTVKFLRLLGLNFLPALEDLSRFLSIILVSTISGSTIAPKFIYSYNQKEFMKIYELAKGVLK